MGKKFEVVVSGISGMFPESNSVPDLKKFLYEKTNLVTTSEDRWRPGHLGAPSAIGKLSVANKFDLAFFGVNRLLAEAMDPLTSIGLKCAFEAVCDAGINPGELSETRTAVVFGSVISESELHFTMKCATGYGMMGRARTMNANRISYYFNAKGPSVVIGCTWEESLEILSVASQLISEGHAVAAIVGVTNMITSPEVSFAIDCMGRLTQGNQTKSFSNDADGYNRSEACVVFFLQRADHARRSYGSVVKVLSTNFGSREQTITGHSPDLYTRFLRQAYDGIDRTKLGFVELDGSANKNTDAMELNTANEVINEGREKPLLVGSIKSNLGHTETASGFVSIVKALIALDTGIIPPNLHFSQPNTGSPALTQGKLQVVTEPTPLEGNLVGVSSIGLMGCYGHVVLKQNPKPKPANRIDDLPRLVVMSGREEEGLEEAFKKVESMPVDEEFVALLHHVFKKKIPNHYCRGYGVIGGTNPIRNIQYSPESAKRPLWFVFSGMGSQWPGMGTSLMKLPTFAEAIHKCHAALEPKGVDLINILTNPDPSTFDSILNSFVGIAAVQIGLVDVLRALGITPDGIVGHSVGELGCAYADGCFTAEQMILSAHARGRASIETELVRGKMAAVGMGYDEIKDMIPSSIEVACHNAGDSCTLSGPDKDVEEFVGQLKAKGVFAKLVNVGNIAYHSRYIRPAAPALLKYLEEVIPTPKPRSATWISSSLPKSQWDSPVAKNSSAEYHTNNLLSPVLFHEAAKEIPADAIVIEIAPHGLLQAILKRSHSSCVNIPLTNKSSKEGLEYLLQSIGRLYLEGVDVDISNIYPKIEFPVSRNTPAIHNLITWSEKQQIESLYKREDEEDIIIDSDGSNGWESLCSQNKINGIEIVPSSVRLNSVIELAKGENETSGKLIHFKNIIFNEAAEIRPTNECETGIQFLKGTGNFEIYRKSPIIKGYLSLDDNVELLGLDEFDVGGNVKLVVKQDFYEYFESVGFEKGEAFRNVEEITIGDNGVSGKVVWNGNWTIFLDALFQIISFYSSMRETKLRLTSNVRNLIFNLDQFTTPNYEVHVVYDVNMQVLRCEGVLFDGIRTTYCNITKPSELKYEEPAFVPYSGSYLRDLYDGITISMQLLFENTARSKVRLFSINGDPKIVQLISDCFQEQGIFQLAITEILDNDLIEHLDLNELQDETCLIVTNNSSDKKALDLFDSLKEGFLLSSDSQLCKMPNTIQSSVLLEFHSNNFDLTFLKKESPFELDSIGIVDFSKGQWEENIESLARRSVAGAKRTYVVDNFTSELSMYNNIKEYQRLLKDKTIRLFLLESSCPKFSPSSQFYEAQIKKDLAVNVYRRGEWGTIRSLRFSPDLLKKSITKLPEKKQFHGFNFDCFGLNLKDEFVQQSSPNTKLGTLEYSGVDGKGKALFGCCSLTEYEFFKRDPILYWEKPDSWTFEQAATVPHAYAIAYSIMSNQIVSYRKTDVFINDGLSPISMAMISIVLSQGIIPYTTYKSEEEKEKIKEIFPQLIDDNMVSHKDAQYGYKILEKTGNEGVSLSINTTDDYRHLKACISCASFRGQFVQVNSRLLNDNNSFGMGWFLKERGCSGIHPDYIINLPDAKKLLIKEEIKRGIETGVVRPLPLQVTKAKEQIHRFIQSNEGCKVVLRNDENAEKRNEYYRCNSDNGYLIVGSNKGFWVDIILWLVQRGALVFCVVFDSEHMSVSNEIRLNSILLQHPNVKIHFLQREKFSSTSAAKSTLFGWSKFYPLASVFVLEKMDKNYLKHLGEAVRELAPKCQVICFETNEWLYEDRCNQGFPTLLIKLGNSIKKPSLILPSLDYLILKMGKIQHIVYISDKTNLCNPDTGVKIPMQKYNFMPKHTGELEDFSLCLGERACFEEVDTLCPRYSVAREFQPFFIVPGLKPNQMDAITSKLLCPAFQVKLPERITSLQTTAEDLVRDLSKFGQTKFTIIASDWGIALALKITELLELKGCSALLVLLGSEPSSVEVCAETMLENNGNKIINKYFKNSPVYQQLNSVNDWDAKLDLLFSDHHMKNLTRNSVLRSGLNAIKNRFEAILSFSVKKEITSKALYIKPRGYTNDSVAALQKHFNEPLKFSETEDVDFEQLARSPQLAKSINSYGLFEYKDCAKETGYKFDQLFYPSQDFDKSVCAIKIQHKNFDDMNSSLLNCMQTNVAKILL